MGGNENRKPALTGTFRPLRAVLRFRLTGNRRLEAGHASPQGSRGERKIYQICRTPGKKADRNGHSRDECEAQQRAGPRNAGYEKYRCIHFGIAVSVPFSTTPSTRSFPTASMAR